MGESVKRSIQHSLQRKIPMSYPMSFKKFLDEGAPNIFFKATPEFMGEDLSGKAKVQKLKKLESLLKKHDWWYSMSSDQRAWKKGLEGQEEIRKLANEIGDEGKKMYREYGIKAGVISESISEAIWDEISPSTRASIDSYMKELESLMKKHNWHWQFDPDERKAKQGQKVERKIRHLVIEIQELGSIEGFDLYRRYAKKNNIKIPYFEDKKTPRKNSYEKFFDAKLKSWKISSPDELEGEAQKRFFDEIDKEWASKKEKDDDVEVNESVQKPNSPRTLSEAVRQVTERSGFPEMDKVVRKGTLGYGDDRKVGEKSISAGSFCDAGNLYPEHLVPKWTAPSPQRKRGWADK